jgi:D-glucosaminate-6-phosphate ammonia-lyase
METITSVYDEIGVVPVINATGHRTVLGGSTPSPRVKAAMEAAERYYVDMAQLHAKAGETIARLLGAEAAYVTSGAAAAIALGTAACITGTDPAKIARLPHTAGLKNQVVMQKAQRYHYDHVATIVGTTIVEAGDDAGTTPEQLAAALGPEVACVLYPAHAEGAPGTLPLRQVVEIAHAKGVPVLVDAAGQVYPLAKFKSYPQTGADLICYGAKYIGSVHSSGILCGRKDLVEAATMQGFIGYETASRGKAFGRPMKLDRQEIVAVVVALQEWMAMDHDRRVAALEGRIELVASRLRGAPGVRLEVRRQDGSSPRVLRIEVDPAAARADAATVARRLREGNPMVYVLAHEDAVFVNPSTLSDDDAEVVAKRLAEVLGPA